MFNHNKTTKQANNKNTSSARGWSVQGGRRCLRLFILCLERLCWVAWITNEYTRKAAAALL